MDFIIIISVIILLMEFIFLGSKEKKKKEYLQSGGTICCPRCGVSDYHIIVESNVVRPEKTEGRYSLNLNPLKPFTLFNYKEKVVSNEIINYNSKFVCNKCGNIFEY